VCRAERGCLRWRQRRARRCRRFFGACSRPASDSARGNSSAGRDRFAPAHASAAQSVGVSQDQGVPLTRTPASNNWQFALANGML
jgi:hypothetical protein